MAASRDHERRALSGGGAKIWAGAGLGAGPGAGWPCGGGASGLHRGTAHRAPPTGNLPATGTPRQRHPRQRHPRQPGSPGSRDPSATGIPPQPGAPGSDTLGNRDPGLLGTPGHRQLRAVTPRTPRRPNTVTPQTPGHWDPWAPTVSGIPGHCDPRHQESRTRTALAAPRDPRLRHARAHDPLSTNTPGLLTPQRPPGTDIPRHLHGDPRAPTPEEPPTPRVPGTRIPAIFEHGHHTGIPGPATPVYPRQRLTKGRSSGLTPAPPGTGTF